MAVIDVNWFEKEMKNFLVRFLGMEMSGRYEEFYCQQKTCISTELVVT